MADTKALGLQPARLWVQRDATEAPQAMTVWQAGQALERWSLEGVAPYQGLLSNKAVEELSLREGCDNRILVLCRSAGEVPERHVESIQLLYEATHEAVCFDRPDSYTLKSALPMYTPGSIPVLLRDEWTRANAATGLQKPVTIVDDWEHAEAHLRQRLQELPGRTLVLINQPSTASAGLNHKILAFATAGLNDVSAGTGIETHAND